MAVRRDAEDELEGEAPEEAEVGELGAAAADPEYRRRRQPVRVRRRRAAELGGWWRRWRKALLAATAGLALAVATYALVFESAWFVLAGSDQITISGARQVAPAAVLEVFASDLGRNVFFIPLASRRRAIEALPWVRQASVLRLWPARLEVRVAERTPVAYARLGSGLEMLDAGGVLLSHPSRGSYDFPVLAGLAGLEAAEPNAPAALAARQPQMKIYAALRAELDRGGQDQSRAFSEIDLADPSDAVARISLPGGGTVVTHFGDRNFAARYALFQSQIAGWRQKYPTLASVDLRYDGEAIVDPGTPAAAPGTRPTPPRHAATGRGRGTKP